MYRVGPKAIFFGLIASFILGCGYHFAGKEIGLPAHIRYIAIPVFENGTNEPAIEETITSIVVREFINDGRLKIVSMNDADAVLRCRITSFEQKPLSIDQNRQVIEYRVILKVDVDLEGLAEKKSLQRQELESSKASYIVTDDIIANKIAKEEAIRKASKDLAEEIINRVIEGF